MEIKRELVTVWRERGIKKNMKFGMNKSMFMGKKGSQPVKDILENQAE